MLAHTEAGAAISSLRIGYSLGYPPERMKPRGRMTGIYIYFLSSFKIQIKIVGRFGINKFHFRGTWIGLCNQLCQRDSRKKCQALSSLKAAQGCRQNYLATSRLSSQQHFVAGHLGTSAARAPGAHQHHKGFASTSKKVCGGCGG